jgi:cytochrome P450
VDLISEFAYPLPALMLADIYGIPREDADLLKRWSDNLKVFIGGSQIPSATAGEAFASLTEMMDYFSAEVRARRQDPREGLVTRLVKAEEDGDFLSTEELCANLALVLGASYVTTMDMIGNGVLALLRQRDQWDLLRRRRDLLPTAIDELVRFDGPVQMTHRLATCDIELHGEKIRQGDIVYLVRAAANRDPARFPDPDRVDVTRTDNPHVGFGAGVHYCIGAALARAEGEAALGALLDRFPDLDLDPAAPPVWRSDSLQFRGLRTLPLVLHRHDV